MTSPFVSELWRFPVKSLRGEQLEAATLSPGGFLGDRVVHLRDAVGRVITARSQPGLLGLTGSVGEDGVTRIDGLPWDSVAARDAVRAASRPDATPAAFAAPDDGQRFDVLPLTVLTDGMISAVGVDHRRFRANIVVGGITGLGERNWVGRGLRIGDALIGVASARMRCVMTTFDPDTQQRDPGILRRIVHEFDGRVALNCWVITPGELRAGQAVEVVALPAGTTPPVGNGGRRAVPRPVRAGDS